MNENEKKKLIEAFNALVDGAEDVEISIGLGFGNEKPHIEHTADEIYEALGVHNISDLEIEELSTASLMEIRPLVAALPFALEEAMLADEENEDRYNDEIADAYELLELIDSHLEE